MLTKNAQYAIRAEIAILDKKHVEIDFAKAILLQALELAEKVAPISISVEKKSVTLPAPGKKRGKQKRAITPSNRDEILRLILKHIGDRQPRDAKEVSSFLNNQGYSVTRKGVTSFLSRQEKAGIIKRHESSNISHVFYTTTEGV
jgi:hypothetical protein